MVKVWTDGATTRFAVVFDKEALKGTTGNTEYIVQLDKPVTNNTGEYLAIKYALERCLGLGIKDVVILSDSQLCICQLKGVYSIRQPHLLQLWQGVKQLEAKMDSVEYRWIPREFNKAGRLLG